jgi:hypothetical protein
VWLTRAPTYSGIDAARCPIMVKGGSASASLRQIDHRRNVFSWPKQGAGWRCLAMERRNMPKAKQMVAWLAVLGIALAVQGCWEDEENRLTLLGDGGCRTADGGEGQPTHISGASLDACKARCFDADAPCIAVEYNANNNNCEIHSGPITTYEKIEGVECYVSR